MQFAEASQRTIHIAFEIYRISNFVAHKKNDLLLNVSLGVYALRYKHLFDHWFSFKRCLAQVRVVRWNPTPAKHYMSQ
jgi:hypothetical protein